MTDTRFTPGPWTAATKPSSITGWPVVDTNGRLIARINYVQHSKKSPRVPGDNAFNAESRNNATLIAASPDQNSALENAPEPVVNPSSGWLNQYANWHQGQRLAALAKARG